jgi:hypothetical protein
MNITRFKRGRGLKALIVAGLATVSGSVLAAVPADVTTAMTDLKTDVTTLASAAFAVFLVVLAFKYFRKSTG